MYATPSVMWSKGRDRQSYRREITVSAWQTKDKLFQSPKYLTTKTLPWMHMAHGKHVLVYVEMVLHEEF
ncbi:hypothetical protein J6590_091234 [Homalodisca vitripennis]|nr:hypothetical protein J6590_091234 [Homalodisca vitripennis]